MAHLYCASLWRVRLAQRCGSLDLCARRGDLWVEVTSDASDAPAGGGSGGGRALSSLGMPTVTELRGVLADEGRGARGAQGLCVALWVCAILDEKRMTGESVNFRLNQMGFVAFIFILHA